MSKKSHKKNAKNADECRSAGNIGPQTRLDSVKQLVDMMKTNDLSEVDISDGSLRISVKRGVPAVIHGSHWARPTPASASSAAPASAKSPGPAGENLAEIKSPMVGTFYSTPSPDSDPYVKAGTAVSPDSVVCIIEAMKVMNEIKAECSGTIVETCVKNAQPVEYGQVLFRVKPS
ncbi:MAG: acetyl-CoA carboxylase biotin carboxyl carrier protein [Planctomycetes bacterium]|nr:acetyl-CoA carboxylase biotin carboxyl carrier protein [Planctomycetota bacterium]